MRFEIAGFPVMASTTILPVSEEESSLTLLNSSPLYNVLLNHVPYNQRSLHSIYPSKCRKTSTTSQLLNERTEARVLCRVHIKDIRLPPHFTMLSNARTALLRAPILGQPSEVAIVLAVGIPTVVTFSVGSAGEVAPLDNLMECQLRCVKGRRF
jgi:hypothetical protein